MNGRHLDLPDAFVAAAAASDRAVLLECGRPGAGGSESLLFRDPLDVLVLERPEDAPAYFRGG